MCHAFGKVVMMQVPDLEHGKLDAHAIQCGVLGIDNGAKAWQIWDTYAHKVHISCNRIFPSDYATATGDTTNSWAEGESSYTTPVNPIKLPVHPIKLLTPPLHPPSPVELPSIPMPIPADESTLLAPGIKPRKLCQLHVHAKATCPSARLAQKAAPAPNEAPTPKYSVPSLPANTLNMELPANEVHIFVARSTEPEHYMDAIRGEAAEKWKESIQKEWDLLCKLGTFKLVKLPVGRKPFKTKTNESGKATDWKSRLIVQGFSQK